MYRFGPLLQQGGHRRLNVAITRARSRMTLVSSFSHHDMDPNRSMSDGVKMLRTYLQFASSGGVSLGDVAIEKPALNPFEISVRDRLVAAGIPLTAQYGVAGYWIDFAAAHPLQPGRMVLAIEADGATYHSSPPARDRDRLRQQLERLGWFFHRIWSTDWFSDPDRCVSRDKMAYERAVEEADAEDRKRAYAGRREAKRCSRGRLSLLPLCLLRLLLLRRRPGRVRSRRSSLERRSRSTWTGPRRPHPLDRVRHPASTEDQVFKEFVAELGFKRRGSRIRAVFDRVLPVAQRERGVA